MKIKVEELWGEEGDSESSSDSDQDIVSRSLFVASDSKKFPPKSGVLSLEQTISEINELLTQGKSIDLSDSRYPKLFVLSYRGTHYFKQFFDQEQRRETRARIKKGNFNDPIYSAALHELAGLKMGEPIDTPAKKNKIKRAKKELKRNFAALEKTRPTSGPWWKTDASAAQHENLLHRHYQRFVNNYKEFREESKEKKEAPYKLMSSDKTPYISTADDARHAVLYALGGKSELEHGSLRPTYIESHTPKRRRAKHPKVGYVQIIFHTLDELARKKPLFLAPLQASKKIDIKDRTLNERETTHKGFVNAKQVVFTQTVRFPSFHVPFAANYHPQKYGITKSGVFSRYANVIDSGEGGTGLLGSLAEHYAQFLENRAKEIAAEKGGHIVYLGLDGTLKLKLPTTLDVRTIRSQRHDAFHLFKNNLKKYRLKDAKEDSDSDEEPLSDKPEIPKAKTFLQATLNNQALELEEYQVSRNHDCGFISVGASRQEVRDTLMARVQDEKRRGMLKDELHEFISTSDEAILFQINKPAIFQVQALYRSYKQSDDLMNAELRSGNDYLQQLANEAKVVRPRCDSMEQLIPAMRQLIKPADARFAKIVKLYDARNEKCKSYLLNLTSEAVVRDYLNSYVLNINPPLWLGYQTAKWFAQTKGFNLYIWRKNTQNPMQLDLVERHEETSRPGLQAYHLLHTDGFTHYNFLAVPSGLTAGAVASNSTRASSLSSAPAATQPQKTVVNSLEAKRSHDRGLIFAQQKRYDEAITCYLEAIKLSPKPVVDYHLSLGEAYHRLENDAASLEQYETVIRIDPTKMDMHLWNRRGNNFFHLKNFPQAILCYETVLRMNPSDSMVKENLERAKKHLGDQQRSGLATSSIDNLSQRFGAALHVTLPSTQSASQTSSAGFFSMSSAASLSSALAAQGSLRALTPVQAGSIGFFGAHSAASLSSAPVPTFQAVRPTLPSQPMVSQAAGQNGVTLVPSWSSSQQGSK